MVTPEEEEDEEKEEVFGLHNFFFEIIIIRRKKPLFAPTGHFSLSGSAGNRASFWRVNDSEDTIRHKGQCETIGSAAQDAAYQTKAFGINQ